MKGGTTALRTNLAKHPNICIPEKEVHFYDLEPDSNDATRAKYYSSIAHCKRANVTVAGTGSPRYCSILEVPYLIHQDNPNTKIIMCIRNPVDRAFSAFTMHHASPNATEFENIIRGDMQSPSIALRKFGVVHRPRSVFIQGGFYSAEIQRYASVFGRSRIHLVCNENTKGPDGSVSYDELFDYLKVPRINIDLGEYFKGKYNGATVPPALRKDLNEIFQPWNDDLIHWLE
ncbi:unnamed protein product, partial [Ectocarpus fasciculatus]